jgi:hypothetical protein
MNDSLNSQSGDGNTDEESEAKQQLVDEILNQQKKSRNKKLQIL